ncbi:MAG TPA: inositol monophosphatase family protein [Acidimicrobiia bacterium]|nr:inositol monophosphatase family protein [Acidimicrobiia bacterium]
MASSPDLTTALSAADAADAVTLPRFRDPDLAVSTKADATVVTEADRRAEQVIREVIGHEAPNDAILGEEYGFDGGGSRRWIIDPIDATVNFVRGVPVWGTLIALEIDGVVTCGVVSAPALGMRWWANRGDGAWCNDRQISVSEVTDLGEAQLSLNSLDGLPPARLDAALALSGQCSRTRGFGDFWAFMLLAEGGVDIVIEPVAAVWDLAPLTVIVEEAGGRFTSLDGNPGIDHGHALATNGHLHSAALAALASAEN